MEESESEDQHELGEYKQEKGFTYRRLGGATRVQQKVTSLTLGKISFTILLLALLVLLLIVVVLQVVTMVLVKQSTPEAPMTATAAVDNTAALSSQMNQIMASFNATCKSYLVQDDQQNNNDSLLLKQLYDVTQASAQKLRNIVQTLSNLEHSGTSTKGAVDDILLVAEELLMLQNVTPIFTSNDPVSCQDIKTAEPDSPSGYYHINSQLVYCEMEQVLCGSLAGWTRVGHLDMTDSAEVCPLAFRLYEGGGVRGCGRPDGGAGCVSVKLPSNGIRYSEVCGRVIGYQFGTPDAVDTRFVSQAVHNDINQHYVDGVSITHGYPRNHIWTFMAGVYESYYDDGNCPCNSPVSPTQQIQSFVGNDYFCESGNPSQLLGPTIYAVDPLWDGTGCGLQEQGCCSASIGLPWFHKMINATTDDIELRECGDENDDNEDVLVNFYDIYVK